MFGNLQAGFNQLFRKGIDVIEHALDHGYESSTSTFVSALGHALDLYYI